jgi:hypothetical protein
MRLALNNFFKESPISSILHPFGFVFILVSALQAMVRYFTGTGVYWKKRLYDKESVVK